MYHQIMERNFYHGAQKHAHNQGCHGFSIRVLDLKKTLDCILPVLSNETKIHAAWYIKPI